MDEATEMMTAALENLGIIMLRKIVRAQSVKKLGGSKRAIQGAITVMLGAQKIGGNAPV